MTAAGPCKVCNTSAGFYSQTDKAWYCPEHEDATQQALDDQPAVSEHAQLRQEVIRTWRARYGAHRGFYNAKEQLFKLMLDDDDILSMEWRQLTRAERRHVQRLAVKQAKQGDRALQRAQQGAKDEQPAQPGEVPQELP